MSIKIEDYEFKNVGNPYLDDVKNLSEAGPNKVGTVTVNYDIAKRAKYKISRAANEIGFTASHKLTVDNGDGTVNIMFTLTKKHKPRIKSEK